MKLYATASSERASKGQGGNRFLEIVLQAGAEERRKVAEVRLEPDLKTPGLYHLQLRTRDGVLQYTESIIIESEAKGNKQTGECKKCIVERNGGEICRDHDLLNH